MLYYLLICNTYFCSSLKSNSAILNSISCLILVVIAYTHLCSFVCAAGIGQGCCSFKGENSQTSEKSCCNHDKQSPSKDCQAFHLSFFKTTGQYTPDKSPDVIKAYQSLTAVITPLFNMITVEQSTNTFAYNVFHPPSFKRKAPIYLLDRIFLI